MECSTEVAFSTLAAVERQCTSSHAHDAVMSPGRPSSFKSALAVQQQQTVAHLPGSRNLPVCAIFQKKGNTTPTTVVEQQNCRTTPAGFPSMQINVGRFAAGSRRNIVVLVRLVHGNHGRRACS
eukprot:scpid92759/ scgid17158/ 